MERKVNMYDVLYCYYENGNKVYKEIPMWNYTEDDVRNECLKVCRERYGSLFYEIVRIKKL